MSRAEELADHFYEWERRGRGWHVSEQPVPVEPHFHPFLFHTPLRPAVDDGRKPTFLSAMFERLLARLGCDTPETALSGSLPLSLSAPFHGAAPDARLPMLVAPRNALTELQLLLPPDLAVSKKTFQQFLQSVAHCAHATSFEVVGTRESVITQLAVDADDASTVRQQFEAHFPEAVIIPQDGFLEKKWGVAGPARAVVECGLSREFMIPIQCHENFGNDPLIAVIGALSNLEKGEAGAFQVTFRATRNPWAESIARSVTTSTGEPFFANAPELVGQAARKISLPLYAAVIRIAARADGEARLIRILKDLAGSLTQFADPIGNELIPLRNDGYGDADHEVDLLRRQSRRSGMLLNGDELASLVHLPSASVRSEKLARATRKTKAAPDLSLNHGLLLGENVHDGEARIVSLAPAQRVRHMHVVGASGTGKSTFLLNMILQDIDSGEGVAVLDPHGDLIDQILARIPESRIEDVILIDPADEEFPVGFNILSAHSTLEKNLLASDLVSVFQRLSTSWGDQMTSVLGNAVLAILESKRGGTLSDLRRFLIEPGFRAEFLKTVDDSEVVYYWTKEFPLLSGRPQASILTRLDTFLRPKPIRHMVVQKENRLDFASIMNSKKIFLAKLAQGLIGVENSYLLGSLLVSKFHQLAMGRQDVAESGRQSFWLYIDEFQNFITPSMAAILSGARKYKLGLVLAHQELQQLQSRDADVASAVLSNAYTRVCFRLGDADAGKLADGFSSFDAGDLQSLGTGEAICRIERSAFDFNLAIPPAVAEEGEISEERASRIIDLSRAKNAARRADVEAALRRDMGEEPTTVPKPNPHVGASEIEMPNDADALAPAKPAIPGKGGQQHKFLQSLIKQWAENIGFRATIEEAIPGGKGSVDVALARGLLSIACEISVTSTVEYELGNLAKCLAAGYGFVLMIGTDDGRLKKLRAAAAVALDADSMKRARFLMPTEAFAFVQGLENVGGAAQTRGYDVEVKSRGVVNGAAAARQGQISDILDQVVKRSKNR